MLIIDIHKLLIRFNRFICFSQIVFFNPVWIIKIFSHTTSLKINIYPDSQALDSILFYDFDSISIRLNMDLNEDSRFYYWKITYLDILPKHQTSAMLKSINIISSISHVWPSTLYANNWINLSLKGTVHLNIIIICGTQKITCRTTNNTKRQSWYFNEAQLISQ